MNDPRDPGRHPEDARPSGEPGAGSADAVDLAFLEAQTFGDTALQRELLELFAAQARRVVPTLPGLPFAAQNDAAHLLKGSARGIGAWPAARAAEAYEATPEPERGEAYAELARAFAAATAAIEAMAPGHPLP